jgi:general secretion pathway protein G
MRFRKMNHARRQAFTLMEVLLVLVILVVLMGFAVPALLGSKKKADIDAAKTQVGLLRPALEKFALDIGTFPSTEQGLEALTKKPEDLEEEKQKEWSGPYISTSSVAKDPWGHKYSYEFPPTHGTGDFPDIWSSGPDGKDGTDDDIVNWNKEDERK